MIDLWPVCRSQFFFNYLLQNNLDFMIKSSDLYTSKLVLVSNLNSHPIDRGSIPSTNQLFFYLSLFYWFNVKVSYSGPSKSFSGLVYIN